VIDLALVGSLGLLLGQLAPGALGPVAAVSIGLAIIAWRHMSIARLAIALLLFGIGHHQTIAAFRSYEEQLVVARDALGAPELCSGVVLVTSSPMKRGDRFSFLAEARSLECEGSARVNQGTSMRLYATNDDLARGDELDIVARLGTVERARNFELEGGLAYAARLGATLSGGVLDGEQVSRDTASLGGWIDRARTHARRRIEASYPQDAAPMARALVLGENDLPEQDAEAFRTSGLSHLLAVSGTHVVLAVLGVVHLLEALLRRIDALAARGDVGRIAAVIGIPMAWAYAEFAGSGGSVRRAAWMATAALFARAIGRCPDGVRAFGLSLLAGALVDPLAAYDVSFGLSAGATAGLLIASRPLQRKLEQLPRPFRWGAAPVAATVSASAFCLPWLTLLSPRFSLVGLFANVLAVPVGELVSLPACLIHLLLAPIPMAERGVALLGSGSLLVVRAIARHGAAMDFLALDMPRPTAWQLAICGLASASLLLHRKRRGPILAVAAASLLLCEVAAIQGSRPTGRLRISFLDVGQGDSIVVDFPDGRAMLIDGGGAVGSPIDPGQRVVAPVLRARRRRAISVAVLSHPHPDHFTGLASTLPTVQVGELWDTGQGERHGAGPIYDKLLSDARARGVPIRRPGDVCGKFHDFGGAQVRVLGPCPDVDERRHANDNSFVLHFRFGERSALLVGDAEREQEKELLKLGTSILHADLLKVGHHGSRTSSSPEFLDAVQPKVAMITSGVRNRYGHPAVETLDALRLRGIRTFRADRHGAVWWETDGQEVWMSTAADGR